MITRDAWLTALNEVSGVDADPSSLTMREFAELLGITHGPAKRQMALLVQAGRATKTLKRIRRGDGQVVAVTSYRLAAEAAHDSAPSTR